MADNVTITAGVGTNVAADDISSVYYQRVKLTAGQDGTAVGDVGGRVVDTTTALSIAATATAAYVDPWTPRRFFTVTPTISTTPAYTAGDCIGGLQRSRTRPVRLVVGVRSTASGFWTRRRLSVLRWICCSSPARCRVLVTMLQQPSLMLIWQTWWRSFRF